ncbi:MAG: leucine-rich repeat domain-containing protein, partial [Candidatus Thorarchaeota archaeon]
LPESLSDLKNLRELDLSYNVFSKLPNNIGNLSKLQVLNLQKTYLESIPESFSNLSSLVDLDCKFVSLDKIPQSIIDLPQLENFWISSHWWWSFNDKSLKYMEEKGCNIYRGVLPRGE